MKRLLTKTIATVLLSGCLSVGFAREDDTSVDDENYMECTLTIIKENLHDKEYSDREKLSRIAEFLYFRDMINDCVNLCQKDADSVDCPVETCYDNAYGKGNTKDLILRYMKEMKGYGRLISDLIQQDRDFEKCIQR